jgi:hypothetical protein
MALAAFGDSKIMNGQITLWQVVAAYIFALAGGSISTSHLAHKPLCALIKFRSRNPSQPDLQYVMQPSSPDIQNALVLGADATVSF